MSLGRLPPLSSLPQKTPIQETFTGQPYRLKGSVHPLPPPSSLRPYIDTKAGEVDTWPAHASAIALSSSAAMLNKNKSLVVMTEEESNKASMVPKPRFLEHLDSFLRKELRALGVTEVTPSDLRLQAHREVFEYLIEDFKTYKPMLSSIKNEYEMMLAFQRQQIRQLEPLKQMLVTVSEQCDQKIMGLRDEERQEIGTLRAENRELYSRISAMLNEQKDLEEQVIRLQETVGVEHQKYRDEADARKLLIADINDLRYQQEDYMASKKATSEQEVEEDPVLLKIALKQARENEKSASLRLNEMIANYGDVIPRRDFEDLEKKYKDLLEMFETLQQDFANLQAEYNASLDVSKQLTEQRDEFYLELQTMRHNSTPRPEWEHCGDYIQGGMARWMQLAHGKTSMQLVEVLLQEIAAGGMVDIGGADYFDPQGTGPNVPKYLHSEVPVRNRRLGKRDTLLLIRDIWREKSASDAERTDGTRQPMVEYLYDYLHRRFPLDKMATEWGYNLQDACQRYCSDEHVALFYRILNDEADEEIFHFNLMFIHGILTQLMREDAEALHSGKLDVQDFQAVLERALPQMDEAYLVEVVKAAQHELGVTEENGDLNYKELFTEDDEGKSGPFLEMVKKWLNGQKDQYVKDIAYHLEDESPVTRADLKRAVTVVDPEIGNNILDCYTEWVFPDPDVQSLEREKVLERLHFGNIRRITPKKLVPND